MIALPLLAVGFIMKVVAALFLICSVALILVILIQKGKGGGLSAAFGGGMASGILGSKTGDFLTWVTMVLVGIFLSLAVVMAKFYKPTVSDYDTGGMVQQEQPIEAEQPTDLGQLPQVDDVKGAPGEADDSAGSGDSRDVKDASELDQPADVNSTGG